MKRTLLALALALFALPSLAAVQYEYTQKTITEDAIAPTTDLMARAIVDGIRSRVEFLSGNLYPPGTYVVSNDGSRLFFVDPTKKWFTEFNAAGVVSSIGANDIRIENVRSSMDEVPDRPLIAGTETSHYRLTIDYNVTLTMRGIPLKQSVHTVIDTWTTMKFGNLGWNALGSGMRTGNAEVDRLLDLETTKINGFPMKQSVSIRTTLLNRSMTSKLQVNPTRTLAREMLVTSVREVLTRATDFMVPADFRRADPGERPRIASETLTFEPAGQ